MVRVIKIKNKDRLKEEPEYEIIQLTDEQKNQYSIGAKRVMYEVANKIHRRYGFFSIILNKLKIVEDWNESTMYTNSKVIGYNPYFVLEHLMNVQEVVFVLLHEILHCAWIHLKRRGERHPKIYNYACDYIINNTLKETISDELSDKKKNFNWSDKHIQIPKRAGGLFSKDFSGMTEEEVYDILYKTAKFHKYEIEVDENGKCTITKTTTMDGREIEKSTQVFDLNKQDEQESSPMGNQPGCPTGSQSDGSQSGGQPVPGDGENGGKDSESEQDGDSDSEQDENQDDKQGNGKQKIEITEIELDDKYKQDGFNKSFDDLKSESDGKQGDCAKPNDGLIDSSLKTEEDWRNLVNSARNFAKGKGDMPAPIEEMLKHILDPQVDWRRQLKSFMKRASKKYTYKIPARRHIKDQNYWPTIKNKDALDQIFIAVDISGSVSQEALNQFAAEVRDIGSKINFREIILVYVDTEIKESHIRKWTKARDVEMEIIGGGGTEFDPPFRYVEEKKDINPQIFIYFTDGYAPQPKKVMKGKDHRKIKYLWVIVDNPDCVMNFGKTIHIDSSKLN